MTTAPAAGSAYAPQPGAAPTTARWWAQARLEWHLLMTNGEQLLLTLVIPVAALVAIGLLGLGTLEAATPGVMALAILSSAFTATAIATGFERRSGVLKLLGATPLRRSGLLVGKVGATFAVIVVQLVLITVTALLLGWDPPPLTLADVLALVVLVALGTLALGAWGFALAGVLRAEATLAVANAIFLLLLFAGGTVLSTDRMPGPMGALVSLLPTGALGNGLRAVLDPAAERLPLGRRGDPRAVGRRRDRGRSAHLPLGVTLGTRSAGGARSAASVGSAGREPLDHDGSADGRLRDLAVLDRHVDAGGRVVLGHRELLAVPRDHPERVVGRLDRRLRGGLAHPDDLSRERLRLIGDRRGIVDGRVHRVDKRVRLVRRTGTALRPRPRCSHQPHPGA